MIKAEQTIDWTQSECDDDFETNSTVPEIKEKLETKHNEKNTIKLWTRQLISELIVLFKAYTNLYDVNDAKYKNFKERAASIANISLQLQTQNTNITSKAIKAKIHNLRTQYQSELRKMWSFKIRGRIYVPTLWCFDELSFLRKYSRYHELINESEDGIKTNEDKEEIQLKEQPTQWTRILIKKLISLLRKNDILYNTCHLEYDNPEQRFDALHKMCQELCQLDASVTIAAIGEKIESLRAQFFQEYCKVQKSLQTRDDNGEDVEAYVSSLWCYNQLLFLLPNSSSCGEDSIVINTNKYEVKMETKLPAIHWSRSMEEVLISKLQEHPSFFDTQHVDYRNLVKRSIVITNISKELQQFNDNVTNEEIRLKIFSLRTQYMQEYQRMLALKRCGHPFVSSLWCFDALTFLQSECDDNFETNSTVPKIKEKLEETKNHEKNTIKLWTRQLISELIVLFKAYTNLYDVNDTKYKNVKERAASIANIALQLQTQNTNITSKAIKAKIHNLRTQYQSELRKMWSFKIRGRIYVPTLWCFDELSFLRKYSRYHELINESEDGIKTNEDKEEIQLKEQPTQWTRILIKKLISLLRKNDILYNTRHLEYDNSEQRFDALHRMCKELCQVDASVTVSAIGEKIESLRAQFLQEYCKVQQSLQTRDENGEDVEAYVSSLWCYNQLLFLIPHSFSCAEEKSSASNARFSLNLCRLCANYTNTKNSKDLFEHTQQKLHGQIEELTGLQLKNVSDLPKYVCKDCEEKTLQAHQFRENCIQAQQHFNTTMYRNQINAYKEELNQTEALSEAMINTPKPVEDAADYDEKMPFVEELIIKDEPNSADEESNNAFKFLINECDEEVIENDSNADNNALKTFHYNNQGDKETSSIVDSPQCNLNVFRSQFFTSTDRKGRICDQCGKHFKDGGSNFKNHMRRHVGIKEFQCEQCSKKFMTKPELKNHKRQHTGEMHYACRYCEQHFISSTRKIIHERRVHTRERPFACNVCGKKFFECGERKEHMQSHTGERTFSCKICNASFVLRKTLLQHFRSITHKKNAEKHPHVDNESYKTFDEVSNDQ